MKLLFINLPHRVPIVRRYGCAYNSPGYAFPPLELLSLATTIREWNQSDVVLVDAISEKMNEKKISKIIEKEKPHMIISLMGFESLDEDLKLLENLGKQGPKTVCFGYLPSLFPREVMSRYDIDYTIIGEPEETLSELVRCLKSGRKPKDVRGLVWRNKTIKINPSRPRMLNLDPLPIPDRRLLRNGRYKMPFFGTPFTTIQTTRGCQFACTYCTHFEGSQLALRSVDSVIGELKNIVSLGIDNVRFMDNNFTAIPGRAKEISRRIIDENIKIKWSCLSRVDLLDEETADLMKRAGCVMVFVGIESGSNSTLKKYKKGYTVEDVYKKIGFLKRKGIKTTGWFIFGAPWETEKDFRKGVDLAKKLELDFAIASTLSYFPGTELFEVERKNLDFTILPFEVNPKNMDLQKKAVKMEKRFYWEFYLRPVPALRLLRRALKYPRDGLAQARGMASYIYSSKNGDLF